MSDVTPPTCLSYKLHAAVGCAGDEAVPQVPTGELPCIDAAETGESRSRGNSHGRKDMLGTGSNQHAQMNKTKSNACLVVAHNSVSRMSIM